MLLARYNYKYQSDSKPLISAKGIYTYIGFHINILIMTHFSKLFISSIYSILHSWFSHLYLFTASNPKV